MPSSEHRTDLARRLTMLFVVADLVNYPWERMRSQLSIDPGGASIPWWLCLTASLADGLFVLMIFGIGWMALGHRTWLEQSEVEGYLVMLTPGGTISVGIERTTVQVLRWWRYDEQMRSYLSSTSAWSQSSSCSCCHH